MLLLDLRQHSSLQCEHTFTTSPRHASTGSVGLRASLQPHWSGDCDRRSIHKQRNAKRHEGQARSLPLERTRRARMADASSGYFLRPSIARGQLAQSEHWRHCPTPISCVESVLCPRFETWPLLLSLLRRLPHPPRQRRSRLPRLGLPLPQPLPQSLQHPPPSSPSTAATRTTCPTRSCPLRWWWHLAAC